MIVSRFGPMLFLPIMAKRTVTASSATQDSSYFTRLGMEVELRNLEEKAAQIRKWLGQPAKRGPGRPPASADGASPTSATTRRRKKRTMSADARRRISEAQKARWAKQRGEAASALTGASAAASAPKAKRRRRGRRRKATKGRGRAAKA